MVFVAKQKTAYELRSSACGSDWCSSDLPEAESLRAEMGLLGHVLRHERQDRHCSIWLDTTCSPGDIEAVCCFIVDSGQVQVEAVPQAVDAPPERVMALPEGIMAPPERVSVSPGQDDPKFRDAAAQDGMTGAPGIQIGSAHV